MNNSWKIYLLATISFLVNTVQFVIGGILDKVAASAGVSVSSAGQIVTAFALANAIGTPIFMIATAKLDRRWQLLMALAIITLSSISTAALPGYGFLMASRIALGVGMGVYTVCSYAIVAKLAPVGRQASAMSNLAMGASFALVLGVPLSRVIAESYDWKIIFWGIGFLSLLAFFLVARAIPASQGESPAPLGKQFAILKNPKIIVALSISFFMFVSYSAINTYIAPYLTSAFPTLKQEVSIVLFGLGIASLLGSKLGGIVADRIGAVRTILFGMSVQASTLVLIAIVPNLAIVVIPLLLVWAIVAWMSGPTLSFNLVSIAPEAAGILLSLNSSFIQFGFAAGAGLGGMAVEYWSILSIGWVGATTVTLAVAIAGVSFALARSARIN